MRHGSRWWSPALLVTGLAGCVGFAEPSPEIRALVRNHPPPPGPYIRARVRVSVESPWLSGIFEGAIVAESGARPRVRLQLFPDMGGKVLDLIARADRIAGYLPQTGKAADHSLPIQGEASVVYCLGLTLLENFAILGDDRLLGARDVPGGWWLLTGSAVDNARIVVCIGPEGDVRERRYFLPDGAAWRQILKSDGSFSIFTRGVRFTMTVVESRVMTQEPAGAPIFELRIPADASPLSR